MTHVNLSIDPAAFSVLPPSDLLGRGGLAVFDRERAHRFWLVRVFDPSRPLLVVCMFNPSDADETSNDPTVSNLLFFAQAWGYGGILIVNLHSYVTSQPTAVKRAREGGINTCPYSNIVAWKHAIDYADEKLVPVLVAWGNLAKPDDREPFLKLLMNTRTICLGTTLDGSPKHPMSRGHHRISREQQPVVWEGNQ